MLSQLSPGGARRVAAVALAGASLVAAAVVGSVFLGTARRRLGSDRHRGPGGAG